jgi:hypothetical protein
VARTFGARSDSTGTPRCFVTRKLRPSSDCAAVAPSATSTRGSSTESSASSHGRQAASSSAFGFWWMRRLPRPSHLKCLTALVT